MRNTCLLFILFVFFASCEKKQTEDPMPGWLLEIIEEKNQNDLCYYLSATRYVWKGEYYYELYSPLSSCYLCDVFDASGHRVSWETYEQVEDYELFRTDEIILWVCDM
jgi:hypothetical protein